MRLAAILLALDALFIAADVLRHLGFLHDPRFAVTTERGFGEWFQYAKAAVIAAWLVTARRKTAAAIPWAGLFMYLLADDALALHEKGGIRIASMLHLPAVGAIHPEQLGELVVYAAVGLAFLGALGAVLARRDPLDWRFTLVLIGPFTLLVFFGAVVDVLHSLLNTRALRYVAGVTEDGGEMLSMSVLLAVVYWITRTLRAPAGRRTP